jgi:hypothetical protein
VRNPFELHDPILQISRLFLGEDAKLILSTEWDFSPLMFSFADPDLDRFVFVGLPATEASNALIIPLVGHEIGHSVWYRYDLETFVAKHVKKCLAKEIYERRDQFSALYTGFNPQTFSSNVPDLPFVEHWKRATVLCTKHCEEIFCDLIGLRIFGSSYLHAFEYLLGPHWGSRSSEYPDNITRVQALALATKEWSLPSRKGVLSSIEAEAIKLSPADNILLEAIDAATPRITPILIRKAGRIAAKVGSPLYMRSKPVQVLRDFRHFHPSNHADSFVEIIAAGWHAYLDDNFWDRNILPSEKIDILSELIFKSIEVMEFHRRVK